MPPFFEKRFKSLSTSYKLVTGFVEVVIVGVVRGLQLDFFHCHMSASKAAIRFSMVLHVDIKSIVRLFEVVLTVDFQKVQVALSSRVLSSSPWMI